MRNSQKRLIAAIVAGVGAAAISALVIYKNLSQKSVESEGDVAGLADDSDTDGVPIARSALGRGGAGTSADSLTQPVVQAVKTPSAPVGAAPKAEPARAAAAAVAPKATVPAKLAAGPTKGASVPSKAAAAPAKTASKAGPRRKAPALKLSALGSKPRVERYVTVDLLNVRSAPSTLAPVVAKLARGSMFKVVLIGDWAKLGENEYVQTKYLSQKIQVHLASRR